jgi:chromate transporter
MAGEGCFCHNLPMQTNPPPPLSLSHLLRIWLLIGLQSFGGGAATLALIHRTAVNDHKWMTDEEFLQEWALCQAAPGINLLALTILIGRRLAGAVGIMVTLFGLLFPSVIITMLFAACFTQVQHVRGGPNIIQAILPATVGLGLLTGFQMARASLAASVKRGRGHAALSAAILVGSGLTVAIWNNVSMLGLLGVAAVSGGLANWALSRTRREEAAS